MDSIPIGIFELLIVLGFALAWGVLELVGLRLDKKRAQEKERAEREGKAS